jgi:ferric-dicitrate binding protein FerR (iron transport regulator)
MEKQTFLTLLDKYINGQATSQEIGLLEEYYKRLDALSQLEHSEKEEEAVRQVMLQNINSRIAADQETEQQVRQLRPRRSFLKWYAAASIVFILSAGSYFFLHKEKPTQQIAQLRDIAPGKNTATLTLANGQKIILSNASTGQIAKQAGVNINKTANGQVVYTIAENNDVEANQFNTLSTAKGETYKVNLPDGTQVWLNAASSLTYPARFTGTDRKVTLAGEGYFEVAKDKAHPFKVATDQQEVTVLGTHFNVNAYKNESATKTTLLEGSVKVSSGNNNQIIKPGQQATLNSNSIKVQDIDTELATAWKNNKFIFDGDDIQYILRMVERWYNVEIEYRGPISKEKFYGAVSRYENVSEVLKTLDYDGKVHLKIEGRKIIVSK